MTFGTKSRFGSPAMLLKDAIVSEKGSYFKSCSKLTDIAAKPKCIEGHSIDGKCFQITTAAALP